MKFRRLIGLSVLIAGVVSCKGADDISPEPGVSEPIVPGVGEYAVGAPIVVRDGMVRFYVEMAGNGAAAELLDENALVEGRIIVGNRSYPLQTEAGYVFADVERSATGNYNAVLTADASKDYAGESNYAGLTIPFSQFSHAAEALAAALPRYAAYNEATGNRLIFGYSAAVLNLRLKGSAKIASVKVEAADKNVNLAGEGWFAPSKGEFGVEQGKNFVSLNATNSGNFVSLDGNGTDFHIFVAPGKYPGGLVLTICDSGHSMMRTPLDINGLAPDEIKTVDVEYSPDAELLFYDGFDNFVWGGDIMSGSGSFGCRPDSGEVTETSGAQLSGYEPALTQVDYSCPGAGAIQPNDWAAVSGKTVKDAHQMSASYVASRNIGDYELLFRVQEFPGYIGVGTVNASGGTFKAPLSGRITSNSDIRVSFDWCPASSFADNLLLKVVYGGRVKTLTIDGETAAPEALKSGYLKSTYDLALKEDAVAVPSSAAAAKKWHHVEAYLENVNTVTDIVLTTSDNSATGKNGFYLDNFEVRKVSDVAKGTLRVLYWNIQNGMWADQHNGYDNFMAWVRRYDPDVCVWCEGETIYMDKTMETMPKANRYLPDGWTELAPRYGHQYVSRSGDRDNYSQTITSRYPIETLRQITGTGIKGKRIVHGAGLFSVTVGGRSVNIISAHLWPQTYSYLASAEDRPASTAENGGDLYRQFEMNWLCTNLYNAAEYSAQENWLMLGDMNSYSRLDNHFYNLSESDTKFLCQNEILDGTDLIDVVGTKYPGEFYSSVLGDTKRVDMAYASPSMYSALSNVQILIDDWCRPVQCTYVTGYAGLPSDHKPILLDFKY